MTKMHRLSQSYMHRVAYRCKQKVPGYISTFIANMCHELEKSTTSRLDLKLS